MVMMVTVVMIMMVRVVLKPIQSNSCKSIELLQNGAIHEHFRSKPTSLYIALQIVNSQQ